jgi:CxxC motif-containing protein (DUF1111 family)
MKERARQLVGLALVVLLAACAGGDLLVEESGGAGTTRSSDRNAFGNSARNLSDEERRRFEVGDSFFTQNWVTAPASTDARDGLGPLFNAQSCSSCHIRDGRGTPDGNAPGLLFRLGVSDGEEVSPDPVYGDQLQDQAILGVAPEGQVRTIYMEEEGVYSDGSSYRLRHPINEFDDLAYGDISVEVVVSPRVAPPVFGAGLLEAIPAADILAGADPDDSDGDGISGRSNQVVDLTTGQLALGRFGWKANVPTVAQQVATAFIADIGITSPLFPDQNCTGPQVDCAQAIDGGRPEIPTDRLDDVIFYNQTLAVPARRGLDSEDVTAGADLFADLGCGGCHQPRHVTGDHAVAALSQQVIFPFTDLLLHDMGPGLADGRADGLASGSEWRTPPLWGIGLNGVVNGHETYLHDGRARSLEEAIVWHGGEGQMASDGFVALAADQRRQLVEFLDSL